VTVAIVERDCGGARLLEGGLFPGAGKCIAQCVFEDQSSRQLGLQRIALEELDEHLGQLPAIYSVWNAEVPVDFIDFFFPMVEGVECLGAEVARHKSIDEADADAATEILHLILFLGPAVIEHFFAGETAAEPGSAGHWT
jgi:hypothetical protein